MIRTIECCSCSLQECSAILAPGAPPVFHAVGGQ